MLTLSGARLVLPDRVVGPASLLIDGDRITEIHPGTAAGGGPGEQVSLDGAYVLPGFVDVHVHGNGGVDALAGPGAIAALAARLPRYGVTAFCPTAVACPPPALERLLVEVEQRRAAPAEGAARVLPAHLESHFIAPAYRGAQPGDWLCTAAGCFSPSGDLVTDGAQRESTGRALRILRLIAAHPQAVGIVTLAPEMDGAVELIHWLSANGHHAALGHSGASFDQSMTAIREGAHHATHLFNRMTLVGQREPGLAGAVLTSPDVAAEIIGDGVHVHPAMVRLAVAAKGLDRVMAVTDGTAGAGRTEGEHAMLGEQPITVVGGVARLADGTMAGSASTMDDVFRTLVRDVGLPIEQAATLCATNPAREIGLAGCGTIAEGATADLVVLDHDLVVSRTYVAGRLAYEASRGSGR